MPFTFSADKSQQENPQRLLDMCEMLLTTISSSSRSPSERDKAEAAEYFKAAEHILGPDNPRLDAYRGLLANARPIL